MKHTRTNGKVKKKANRNNVVPMAIAGKAEDVGERVSFAVGLKKQRMKKNQSYLGRERGLQPKNRHLGK